MKSLNSSAFRVAALCLAALGVPTVHASREHPVIGLSLDSFRGERWQRERDTFVSAVQQSGGHVLVQSADWDNGVQIGQIEAMLKRGVDAIVVMPHDTTAIAPAIKAANAANVPIVSYDRLIRGADIAYYVSFNNTKVGTEQAQYIAEHLPAGRKARIVRIYGSAADNNATVLKQNQDAVLDPLIQAGKIEVVHEGWAENWGADPAAKIMTAAIAKAGLDLDAVLASNDRIAGGAISAFIDQGGDIKKLIVTGQDADLAACARIREGIQSMTVYKPVDRLATLAATVAVALARGQPPAPTTTVDNGFKSVPAILDETVVSVDKDNLASTVIAAGFHHPHR